MRLHWDAHSRPRERLDLSGCRRGRAGINPESGGWRRPVKSGKGGDFTFGHPSGKFSLHTEPNLDKDPNKITYQALNFPRTARIICDGAVYIKESRRKTVRWEEADDYTASSFFLLGDTVSVQR